LARVAAARDEADDATQFREKAATLYTQHGARLWLERMNGGQAA
jgi:hypothetical protein